MFMVLTIVQLVEPYDAISVQIVATQGLVEKKEFKVSVCLFFLFALIGIFKIRKYIFIPVHYCPI